jgi:hypothetical protein
MATSGSQLRMRHSASRGRDRREEAPDRSHCKNMLRGVTHKVLGRGRQSFASCLAPRARVLKRRRAGADMGRWAALRALSASWGLWRQCGGKLASPTPQDTRYFVLEVAGEAHVL